MNEIDDLLGTCNNSNTNYYKNNYKEQNKRRNEAYKKIDDMSFKILKDDESFKKYLNILSRFEKYILLFMIFLSSIYFWSFFSLK